jgi:hypothetical protein
MNRELESIKMRTMRKLRLHPISKCLSLANISPPILAFSDLKFYSYIFLPIGANWENSLAWENLLLPTTRNGGGEPRVFQPQLSLREWDRVR